jgi:hypothetical protein
LYCFRSTCIVKTDKALCVFEGLLDGLALGSIEKLGEFKASHPAATKKTIPKKNYFESFPLEPNYQRNYNMPHAAQDHSRDPWYADCL